MRTRNLIGTADILAVVMRTCLFSLDPPPGAHGRIGSGNETISDIHNPLTCAVATIYVGLLYTVLRQTSIIEGE